MPTPPDLPLCVSAHITHQAWLSGGSLRLREFAPIQGVEYDGGALEFSDGSVVTMADHVAGLATWGAALSEPPVIPERPTDFSGISGRDLACWCPLVDGFGSPVPCHANVLLKLANPDG